MSDGLNLDVPKLSDQEMQQLQVLLFRYLAHKSGGFADILTDKLVHRCQLTPALAPAAEFTEAVEAAEPVASTEPIEIAEPEPRPPVEVQRRKAKTPEPAVVSE